MLHGPLSGRSVSLFLILGQRKQGDRWVKLDETLRSHSPSIGWASAKTTAGRRARAVGNAFTGAHPLRSLMAATMCLLAALRHIRSSARKRRPAHRTTLAGDGRPGLSGVIFCRTPVPKMTAPAKFVSMGASSGFGLNSRALPTRPILEKTDKKQFVSCRLFGRTNLKELPYVINRTLSYKPVCWKQRAMLSMENRQPICKQTRSTSSRRTSLARRIGRSPHKEQAHATTGNTRNHHLRRRDVGNHQLEPGQDPWRHPQELPAGQSDAARP